MNLLHSLLGIRSRSAREAKDRLQFVLIHDRADLSPGRLNALKDEMIELLSHYVEIDQRQVKISLTSERDQQRLVVDIRLASERAR